MFPGHPGVGALKLSGEAVKLRGEGGDPNSSQGGALGRIGVKLVWGLSAWMLDPCATFIPNTSWELLISGIGGYCPKVNFAPSLFALVLTSLPRLQCPSCAGGPQIEALGETS